jgi:hypothetical protein
VFARNAKPYCRTCAVYIAKTLPACQWFIEGVLKHRISGLVKLSHLHKQAATTTADTVPPHKAFIFTLLLTICSVFGVTAVYLDLFGVSSS